MDEGGLQLLIGPGERVATRLDRVRDLSNHLPLGGSPVTALLEEVPPGDEELGDFGRVVPAEVFEEGQAAPVHGVQVGGAEPGPVDVPRVAQEDGRVQAQFEEPPNKRPGSRDLLQEAPADGLVHGVLGPTPHPRDHVLLESGPDSLLLVHFESVQVI